MAEGNGVQALATAPIHTTTIYMDTYEPFAFPTDEELKVRCETTDDLHKFVQQQLFMLNGRRGLIHRYKASARSFPQLNLDIPMLTKNLDDYFIYLKGLHERYSIPF